MDKEDRKALAQRADTLLASRRAGDREIAMAILERMAKQSEVYNKAERLIALPSHVGASDDRR